MSYAQYEMVHLGSDIRGIIFKQWRIKVGLPEATKTQVAKTRLGLLITNEFFGFSEPLEGHLYLKSLAQELLIALLP